MELHAIKTADGLLRPATETDRDELGKLRQGRIVRLSMTRSRNPDFHAKFFALLRIGFAHQDRYEAFEAFRYELTVRCGFFYAHTHVDGSVSFYPRSIAFHSMEQDEFERLYSQAIDVLLQHFLIDLDDEDLREAVAQEVVRFAA